MYDLKRFTDPLKLIQCLQENFLLLLTSLFTVGKVLEENDCHIFNCQFYTHYLGHSGHSRNILCMNSGWQESWKNDRDTMQGFLHSFRAYQGSYSNVVK